MRVLKISVVAGLLVLGFWWSANAAVQTAANIMAPQANLQANSTNLQVGANVQPAGGLK
jgi:high-affinity Fe2+/Pb2+ permease